MRDPCEEVLRRIEVYLDAELPAPQAAALAEHLEACPECLEHEVFLSRLRQIVRSKLGATPGTPPEVVDRIRSAIALEHIPHDTARRSPSGSTTSRRR